MNRRLQRYIWTILGLFFTLSGHTQGLKFNNADLPIDERTSYNVFETQVPEFRGSFDIEFDMSLYPVEEIGYVIRIKSQSSSKIYNLFYDGRGDDVFKLNEEGKCNLITAKINRQQLLDAHWFRMKLSFDMQRDSIGLMIHDRNFGVKKIGLPDSYRPEIVFGKSDYIIDVPSFAIKNLSVGNQKRYFFPLNESEGGEVYDQRGRHIGHVSNPEWLINDAFHWKYKQSFASKTPAGAAYNAQRKEIYYYNRDTIFVYNIRTEQITVHPFRTPCPVKVALGMNFLDTSRNQLYTYEVYDDTQPAGEPTVASYDLDSGQWEVKCNQQLPTQLHHHSAYFDPDAEQYTIYGGFGNMRFSGAFNTYDLATQSWHVREGLSGDPLFPRYFSSMGYLKQNNSIYVFGGMGNESGDQAVGRYYLYDLHKIDLNTNQVTKLWEIPWDKTNSVPVRSMILLEESHFYTLCYPESVSDSYLRLYRFSIEDGSYEILGDSIPIHSDKITTNANLYYDEQQSDLVATVQEFDDNDIASQLKVYTLAFPPINAAQLKEHAKPRGGVARLLVPAIALLLVLAAIGFAFRRRIRSRYAIHSANRDDRTDKEESENSTKPNSISLFGDFSVRDRHNRDITYLFTARQKQTFCLILQYSTEEGISSQRLSNLLWPDKPEDRVKNSRGVAINHLRKTLKELDGIELIYNKGCFKFTQQAPFYCDYTRCVELLTGENIDETREELIQILTRGKFLKFSDQPLFDSFKESVERQLEPILQLELENSFTKDEWQIALDLAEAIFNIDPLNDNALTYQLKTLHRMKRDDEARLKYQAFVLEYKRTFNAEYPHPFKNY